MIKKLILASCLLLTQVSAAQNCKDTINASTPDSRFIVEGDEVMDLDTGLIWQRCTLGQTGDDCSGGSASAYTWLAALQAAGASWRLPNIKELRSIVEEKCVVPAINSTIFPNTQVFFYWSASPLASHGYEAWEVDFNFGDSWHRGKDSLAHVRLVRDGL